MLEIPNNVLIERAKTMPRTDDLDTVPDEWKTIPALTEEEAKVYRTKIKLLVPGNADAISSVGSTVTVPVLTPVFSGNKCIGCVSDVFVDGEDILVGIIIDYHTPERLDLEQGGVVGLSMFETEARTHLGSSDYKLVKVELAKE